MNLIRIMPLLALLALGASCPSSEPGAAVRVVVFWADGAGAGHWGVARHALDSLAIDHFTSAGLSDTRGADHIVTESATSATAVSIGLRSYFSAVAVGPDSLPRETALEIARSRGMATGVVTTTYIFDATPAAFSSHSPLRRDYAAILRGMLANRPEIIMGGGRRWIDSAGLLPLFLEQYPLITTAGQLDSISQVGTRVLGLFAERDMPLAPARSPSLARMTSAALEMLGRNDRGFFLLVENEETDTRAHRNEPYDVIAAEMHAFDEAVRVALEYRETHPDMLILVLADHETGGMSLMSDTSGTPVVAYLTEGHTAEPIPFFAVGRGARHFTGYLRNEEVGQLLARAVRGELD